MTRLPVVLVGIAMLIAGTASAEPSGDPFGPWQHDPEKTMTAEEVARYAQPYLPRIARCYRMHAMPARTATGNLELYVVIARPGNVVHLDVTAPGVPVWRYTRLAQCVRDEVVRWRFPARTGFTNAVIPYFFLHTRAPASGPFPGCWKAKGCPVRPLPRR